ncbi:MAG: hypothetical protein JST85_18960 [Acidobacteria bacterium]|nr:hypothetical protein [Acidobacteriota bacterium]
MTSSNHSNHHFDSSDQDFDHFLREIDDLYGDANNLVVPPHFVARLMVSAQTESVASLERQNLLNWFWGFSLSVRIAAVSVLLLASFGGVRAGMVITDLVMHKPKAESATQMEMTPTEQSLVQLVHSEAAAVAGKTVQQSGAAQ